MKVRVLMVFVLACMLAVSSFLPVQADGILPPCKGGVCPIPPPCRGDICIPVPPRPLAQLVIKYHKVDVTITDQIAITQVDQVFYNPNPEPIEGSYIFPLPVDAVVNDFHLWVDGEPVQGKVMDADQARKLYEDIVRSSRDPALLEYTGRGAVEADLFPIPAQGERRIQLEYTQALTAQNGLVHYVYPLNTEKFSRSPIESVSINVKIKDHQAIRAVYSPSHAVNVKRDDDHNALVSFATQKDLPDTDFSLYYSLGESEAFHLLSYRNPGDSSEADGFFLLLLAPKPGESSQPMPKDVILVLDRSGSMDGTKFTQAQSALRYILKKLNPEDRFHLMTFSTAVESYASGMRPVTEVPEALAWVDGLNAEGSTDINRALLDAVSGSSDDRPTYLIFLTDGLPTEGERDSQKILENFARSAPQNLRLFTFGVGYNVDTFLLDSLSSQHHGLSTYVRPDDPLDEVLSAFYEKISTPVMTNLQLDFGQANVYDVYPQPMPDLFAGNQSVIVGRYRSGGATDISLQGNVNGKTQTLHFDNQVLADDNRGDTSDLSALPRLWATRKIGYLLNKIRLSGPDQETIDQIVRLSVRYGIVTEYTSYLVTEPMPLGASSQDKIAHDAYAQAQSAAPQITGEKAFDRAAQEGQLQSAQVAPSAPGASETQGGSEIKMLGQRTFILTQGVWTDTTFDPEKMQSIVVPFLSEDYFKLAQSRPDLAAALAIGEQVLVVVDGKAYRVQGTEANSGTDVPLPATLTPGLNTTKEPLETSSVPGKSTQELLQTQIPTERSNSPGCTGMLLPLGAVAGLLLYKKRK
jgi:Ca-activated chloride channel homolog